MPFKQNLDMNMKRKSKELNEVPGSAECWRWKIHLICPKRPLGLPWAQSFWISDTQCFQISRFWLKTSCIVAPLSLLKAKTLPPAAPSKNCPLPSHRNHPVIFPFLEIHRLNRICVSPPPSIWPNVEWPESCQFWRSEHSFSPPQRQRLIVRNCRPEKQAHPIMS